MNLFENSQNDCLGSFKQEVNIHKMWYLLVLRGWSNVGSNVDQTQYSTKM